METTNAQPENKARKCKDRNDKSPEQSPRHLDEGKLDLSLGFLTKSINCEPLLTVWDITQLCSLVPRLQVLILCFPQDLCASFHVSVSHHSNESLYFPETQAPSNPHLDYHGSVHGCRFVGLTVS